MVCIVISGLAVASSAHAGDPTVLPAGSVLGETAVTLPREILHDEAASGRQSDLAALGNLAFESPQMFGDVARKAGISCETCHSNGDINRVFFIPGLSDRPGGLAVVNHLFNPRTDDGLHRHIDIPSLRGVRFLGPYGRDGRIASLREFTRNVIVNEFAGPEPSPGILDALVAYMEQIDFLPNPKLTPEGRLTEAADAAARRGQALFNQSFPQMGGQACASCHRPSALFVDHQLHDIGSGGVYRTPTLLNAEFSAPYFHDGRFANFAEVVDYFDGRYKLGLKRAEKEDLVAYLDAVGDAKQPFEAANPDADLDELMAFARPLDRALAEHDQDTISLIVNTIAHEMRELQERFPGPTDPLGADNAKLLRPARAAGARLVIAMRRVALYAGEDRYEDATQALAAFRRDLAQARPVFAAAVPVSLYNPDRAAHHLALIADVSGQ
ncbi:MAG: hypothetical protein QOK29_1723 [Rhodospirillaceae bacterium]|nr:hypothetical protein [Rhodospirillaceae bacterium]